MLLDYFWRRQWQPTPVLLPGKSHGRRSLVGYSPWGCKESDTTERLDFDYFPFFLYFLTSLSKCTLWTSGKPRRPQFSYRQEAGRGPRSRALLGSPYRILLRYTFCQDMQIQITQMQLKNCKYFSSGTSRLNNFVLQKHALSNNTAAPQSRTLQRTLQVAVLLSSSL